MSDLEDGEVYQIVHLFADHGVESEVLSAFGHVTRFTIDPRPTPFVDETIQMDLMDEMPSGQFDLAILHPNCGDVADTTSITGDPDDQEFQITRAREIAQSIADHYVIENKPRDELRDPAVMTGYQFGLPFEYKRAFESTFSIETPVREQRLAEKPVTPYFYSDRTKEWWLAAKGYRGEYPKGHLAKNALPSIYIETIVRSWLEAVNDRDATVPQDNNDRPPRELSDDQATLITDGGEKLGDAVDRELVHGDAFELLPELDSNSAHCAVVDYPWDFDTENGAGLYENFYETEPAARFSEILEELERVLADGSWLFAFADDEISPMIREEIEDSGFKRRQTCVWDFDCMSMGCYHRVEHYPILTATNGETDRQLRDRGTIYEAQRATGAVGIGHDRSTAKPINLYRQMVEPPVLNDDERLLEPFAGTAPGLRVCQERDLGYWGADLDQEIVAERQSEPEAVSLRGWSA